MKVRDSWWGIRCVWRRYFDVFRKNILYGLMTTFLEPILNLLAFGYGLGGMIGTISVHEQTLSYRQFIFGGIVCQSILFQGFFDAAYGSFVRMYYQRIFKSIATTPITLSEVLWGELGWDASRATFSASVVLLIGTAVGDFSPLGSLLCLPVCFAGALIFSALGLLASSLAKSIEQINYPQYLVVFPMFLFCGVYFPLERLPQPILFGAWCFPLTSLVSLVRTLTLGLPFHWQTIPILLFWMVSLVTLSRSSMMRRLIK
jgi:lipooligosaccharide transport system permease protein